MAYNADIEESIENCTELEQDIGQMIEELAGIDQGQRRKLVRDIEDKLKALRADLAFMDCEVNEMRECEEKEEYKKKYELHQESLKQLEDNFAFAGRNKEVEDIQNQNRSNDRDLMDKATKLQQEQKNSLDQSLNYVANIEQVGADTAIEIKRQQDQIEKVDQNLKTMDSELERAKKVMKSMIARAAGDNCVRVLLIIVVLAIIAVIVVEIVSPGAVKNQIEGGFNVENGGNNQTVI